MKTIELNSTVLLECNKEAFSKKCKNAVRNLIKTYNDFCKFVKPMYVYPEEQFMSEKEA